MTGFEVPELAEPLVGTSAVGYFDSFVFQRLGKATGVGKQPVDDSCLYLDTTVGIFAGMGCYVVDFYSYNGKHAADFGVVH